MPVVTTLHTILEDPSPDQRRVPEEIAALSDRVVVMSKRGMDFLQEAYRCHELPRMLSLSESSLFHPSRIIPAFLAPRPRPA
jgi:hypothetical protein